MVKVVSKTWWSYGVDGERGALSYSADLWAEPTVGSRGKSSAEVRTGGIQDAKNKTETEKINSNKSRMENMYRS